MKLQHLMIIFALIFVPIILITSYYIQKQVDTIDLQLSYDSKLLDATYDAMSAFEINTANEDISTVSDSLRSIIEASNSIFLNTLATNLGYSNASLSYVQPYIPAVLYILYDGFYIYAPSNEPEVLTDKWGQTLTVGDYGVGTNNGGDTYYKGEISYDTGNTAATGGTKISYSNLNTSNKSDYGQILYKNKDGTYSTSLSDDTYYKQDYILKSYVPYSAHYESGDINVTINYTLDNFISITGTIGDVYYSKSGYLIDRSLITGIKVVRISDSSILLSGNTDVSWDKYSDEKWEDMIYDPEHYEVSVTLNIYGGDSITISNRDTYVEDNSVYWDDVQSAVEYYIDSCMFSEWVYNKLGRLTVGDCTTDWGMISGDENNFSSKETSFSTSLIEDFTDDNNTIFNSEQNPEGESTFEEHRRKVIKNSINYNLALAMLSYSDMRTLKEYDLPIFTEDDWETILNNVSVVSFMQGLSCGLKYYNNYAIATSTNNEITVTTSEIYYVPIKGPSESLSGGYTDISDDIEEDDIAHRIDCSGLEEGSQYYISFTSKEVKYDKVYDVDVR